MQNKKLQETMLNFETLKVKAQFTFNDEYRSKYK